MMLEDFRNKVEGWQDHEEVVQPNTYVRLGMEMGMVMASNNSSKKKTSAEPGYKPSPPKKTKKKAASTIPVRAR